MLSLSFERNLEATVAKGDTNDSQETLYTLYVEAIRAPRKLT